MAIQIQIRRDTTANWASNNPVLAQGEIGLNLDLNLIKIGDGISSWNSLQYYSNLTDIQSLTANWENTYTTVQANSANYDYAYNTIINGGTIGGDLTVVGTISATNVLATSATITKIDISQYELSGFVSTGDLVVEGNISAQGYLSADSMYFNTGAGLVDPAQGQIIWDADDQVLRYGMNGVTSRISQDQYMRVKATETIVKGQAVRAAGASGDGSGNITGALYSANSASGVNEIFFVGLAAEDMSTNDFGFVQTQGKIHGVSVASVRATDDPEYSLPANEGWAIGTILYVSPFDTGKLTQTKPTAPNIDIAIAIVISTNGNQRSLYTRYEHGYHLDEIHDVRYIQPLVDGDLLTWDNTLSAWINKAETDPIFYTWAQANSASYESTYTTVNTNSADWSYQGTDIKALTSDWQSTYTTVNTNSANWDYQGTDIKALTANYDSTFTTVNTNSANWDYQGTDIKALTANWENTYTTVQSTSASWDSTVSFNESTAELSVGTSTTSLSALSGTSGGGLTHFTEGRADTGVNAAVPVVSLTATGAEANIDAAIVPKGTGAILADVPDGTTAGGNKRGANAIDLQASRTSATQVASGPNGCVCIGINNTAAESAVAIGRGNSALNYDSVSIGKNNSATFGGVAIGWANGALLTSIAIGQGASSTGTSVALYRAIASRTSQFAYASNSSYQFVSFVAWRITTNATPAFLALNGSSTRFSIPSGRGMACIIEVFGFKSDGSAAARYTRRVGIKNVAGTTSLIGSVEIIGTDHEDNSSTDLSITADDTNDALDITVTGIAAETWRWVAAAYGVELAYGT